MKPNPLLTMIRDLQCRVAALEKSQGILQTVTVSDAAQIAETTRELCCQVFRISLAQIKSHQRPEHIAWPRQIAMYLTHKVAEATLSRTGECFHLDHGTVFYARRRVLARMDTEPLVKRQVEFLEAELRKIFPERSEAA